jgi:hypothetical protein
VARFFVSYRRDDSAGHAGRLFDRLKARFGAEQTFIDVDLAPGVDYVKHIHETVGSCDGLIVVIGPRWADSTAPDGSRRLDDPDDLVRLEIETGLRRDDVVTIPVLVQCATMPDPARWPPSLRPLTRRNALEVTDSRFDYDTNRLVQALERAVRTAPTAPSPTRAEAASPSSRRPPPRVTRRLWIAFAVVSSAWCCSCCSGPTT